MQLGGAARASRCRRGCRPAARRGSGRRGRRRRRAGPRAGVRRPARGRRPAPVGRSLSEWTATSMRPSSSASRRALTKTPVPPSCASGRVVAVAGGGHLDQLDLAAEGGGQALGHPAGLGHGEERGAGAEPDRAAHDVVTPQTGAVAGRHRAGHRVDGLGVEGEELGERGGVRRRVAVAQLLDPDRRLVDQLVGDPAQGLQHLGARGCRRGRAAGGRAAPSRTRRPRWPSSAARRRSGVRLAWRRADRNASTSSVTMVRTASTSAPASDSWRSPARSARVTRVTPGRSTTDGSMSWGRARSTMASGPGAAATASRLIRTPEAPAQAMTTSASAISASRALSGAQRAAYSPASRSARSGVRLTTTTSPAPRRTTVAMARPAIAPAPTTTTRRPRHVVGGAVERGGDEGRGGPVDVGLGVGALADAQRLLEEGVEGRADGAELLAEAERVAGLAEDLGLADGHRVEAGRDLEEVGDGAVVVVDVEVRQHRLDVVARPGTSSRCERSSTLPWKRSTSA